MTIGVAPAGVNTYKGIRRREISCNRVGLVNYSTVGTTRTLLSFTMDPTPSFYLWKFVIQNLSNLNTVYISSGSVCSPGPPVVGIRLSPSAPLTSNPLSKVEFHGMHFPDYLYAVADPAPADIRILEFFSWNDGLS